MANLLDSVKEYLHPGFIAEAAEQLGEGEAQVADALFAWCAAILAGLQNWVGHEKAIGQIFHHLGQFPTNLTENPKALLIIGNRSENDPKDIAGNLLEQLFGPKTEPLIKRIASISGASPENVSHLLGVSGPLILSILGQRTQSGNLTHSGLSNLLLRNRKHILKVLPAELSTILELRDMAEAEVPVSIAATGFNWALPFVFLLALGGFILVCLRYAGN